MDAYRIVFIYLVLVNTAALVLYGADKLRAKRGRWRIPEARLLWAAALGGSVGALAGMLLFRHKIRKPKFFLGVPLLLAAQLALTWFLTRSLY